MDLPLCFIIYGISGNCILSKITSAGMSLNKTLNKVAGDGEYKLKAEELDANNGFYCRLAVLTVGKTCDPRALLQNEPRVVFPSSV